MAKRGLRLAVACALVVLVAVSNATAEQFYTDPVGDGGPGTDITGITVRNDNAGMISIQVGSASPIVSNHAIAIGIDADRNQATGVQGDEFWMFGGPLVGSAIFAAQGGRFVEVTPPSFSAGKVADNVTEFKFNAADIGKVTSFDFYGFSISIDESSVGLEVKVWDDAPANGYFTYTLAFPQCGNGLDDDGDGRVDAADLGCANAADENEGDEPVTLRASKAVVKPAKPKAGARVTVSTSVTRVETGAAIDSGSAKCAAKVVGGTPVRGAARLAGGKAACTFTVPKNAAGKTIRGTVTVTYETAKVTVPFSVKVAK